MYRVTIINNGTKKIIHSEKNNDIKLTSAQIKKGLNSIDSFTFSILPNNPGYYLIHPLKTLINVYNTLTQKYEFEGRILMPTDNMNESGAFSKSFVCESELGFLNDSCQRHGEYHDMTIRQFLQTMISRHNAEIANDDIDKTFTLGNVTVTNSTDNVYRYLSYDSTWKSIKEKLIDRLGGYLKIRKVGNIRYLDYLESAGELKSTDIRLAKNLKSITRELDPTEVITRLVPLGQTIANEDEPAVDASQARLTIASVNNGKDYIEDPIAKAEFGIITKAVAWDDVTTATALLSKGQQYITENNRVKSKYSISALDLSLINRDIHSFEIGNSHPVINPVMNINDNLKIIEKNINVIKPNDNSLVVGDIFKTLTEYQLDYKKSAQEVVSLKSVMNAQIRKIAALQEELTNVDNAIETINQTIQENDISGLEQAVSELNDAINDLNDAIDDIPEYSVATNILDGLMPATDKGKLDLITLLNSIDLDALKSKLDLITVVNAVDLDLVVSRLEALENTII